MLPGVSTVGQRIEWVLQHKGISARELARRSDLAGAIVSNLLKTLREDPDAVTLRTLRQIAQGADVSFTWLVTGEEAGGVVVPSLPARAEAAERAKGMDVWPPAIQLVMAEEPTPDDASRPAQWWLLRMQLRELELLEDARRRLGRAAPAPRTPPGAPRSPPDESGEMRIVKHGTTKRRHG
jgi:transcriptional regulator with XRE-family HTH domain